MEIQKKYVYMNDKTGNEEMKREKRKKMNQFNQFMNKTKLFLPLRILSIDDGLKLNKS